MNILVTGANGQLGSELRTCAASSRHTWHFTDVAELDISDPQAVTHFTEEHQIGAIVNCAAYTNVDAAEDEPELADKINHLAVKHLADAAKVVDATLFHVSTDYVFGGTAQNTPLREEDRTSPLGAYGQTKLAGEEAVRASGCKHLVIRTAWLYSPYGKNFLKTMLRLTSEKETLRVVFDQIGTPTYAADLARFIVERIENRDFTGHEGTYHFSNEGVCSWYDFAHEINRMAGHKCHVTPCRSDEYPTRAERPAFSVLDKSKIKNIFHITVPHWTISLEKCLKEIF